MFRKLFILFLSVFLIIPFASASVSAETDWKSGETPEETCSERIDNGNEDSIQSIHSMTDLEYRAKYAAFLADPRWKDTTPWSQGMTPYLGGGQGTGCFAYASDFAKYMYGENLWSENTDGRFYGTSEIRAGDILRTNEGGQHWVVVLERNGDSLTTAEGAVNWRPEYWCDYQVLVASNKYKISDGALYNSYSWTNVGPGFGFHYLSMSHSAPINHGNDAYGFLIAQDKWLHLTASATDPYKQLTISEKNNGRDPRQIFHLVRQSDGSYHITNEYWEGYSGSSWYVDAKGAGTVNGTAVTLCGYSGSRAQNWYFYAISNEPYQAIIMPGHCSLTMDITGGNMNSGTPIQLYEINHTASQYFVFYNVTGNGWTYSKPGRPSASVYTGETSVAEDTEVNLSWTASALVNDFDKRTYTLTVNDENGNTVLKKEGLTETKYPYTFEESGQYSVQIRAVNSYYRDWYTDSQTVSITVGSAGIPVTAISLSETSITMTEGSTHVLTALVSPDDATDKTIIWSSSDSSVADVNSAGLVTALKAGTAVITAASANGTITASCDVTVEAKPEAVSGVSLDKTNITLIEGSSSKLRATVLPDSALNTNVSWNSADPSIATVSATGTVKAISAGTTVITVTTEDGGKTASCTVTVTARIPVDSISLDKATLSMKPGDSENLTVSILPANATNRTVSWSSDNTEVATVAWPGIVTAVKAGTAVITATAEDGNKTASCTVTVTDVSDPISIESVSLALKEKIESRFYVYVPDSELATTDINLTFNGKTTTYHAADITPKTFNSKPCRIVSAATFAKQMRDDIKVTVTKTGTTDLKYLEYKEAPVTEGLHFKIEDYVKLVEEKSADEKLIDLVHKMDNYGKYAQIQFNNYNRESFTEPDNIPEDYDDSRLVEYLADNDGAVDGLEYTSGSLELESDTGLRVYFKLTGSDTISSYTFKVDGTKATPVKKGTQYYVSIKNIPARLMSEPHTVTVTDKAGNTLTTTYSGLSYPAAVLASTAAPESLKNLARAIDLYAEAALAYFGE